METKKLLLPSVVLGFGISYSRWYNFIIGFWNLIFAIILSYIFLFVFYKILCFFARREGFEVSIEDYNIKKETKYFSYTKKEVIKLERVLPFGYLVTLFFIFLTAGNIFPFLPITFKLSQHPVYKVGKSKKEMEYDRRFMILFKSLLVFLTLILFLKYFLSYGILNYFYQMILHLSFIFLLTYLFPWSSFLSIISVYLLKSTYTIPHIGDVVIMIDWKKYLSCTLFLLIYFLGGYFLDPLLALILAAIFSIYLWYRAAYREFLKNI